MLECGQMSCYYEWGIPKYFLVISSINPTAKHTGSSISTQNNSKLLEKLEPEWLPEPTGGSTDVHHLIINTSQVSGWLLKASVWLQPKVTIERI